MRLRKLYVLPFVALTLLPAAAVARDQLDNCAVTPADAAVCRLTQQLNLTEVLNRLGTKTVAWWRDGDRFIIVARAKAARVRTCCAFQEEMDRIPATDIWTLIVRSPHLDSAIIDIETWPDGVLPPMAADVWRGPKAPPAPPAAMLLTGRIETIEIDSPNLGEKRNVSVYLPPGFDASKRYPVIYMADGQSVRSYSQRLEALVTVGKLPPIVLVGLHAGRGNPVAGNKFDRRNLDYLTDTSSPGDQATEGDAYFLKHEAFFLKEVMPLAEHQYGASPDPNDRLLLGVSSGAFWAVETALRHPDAFPRAAGLSVCWNKPHALGPDKPKLFLGGGLFERCGTTTAKLAQAAKAAGEDVVFVSYASGHSRFMWEILFGDALAWAWGTK